WRACRVGAAVRRLIAGSPIRRIRGRPIRRQVVFGTRSPRLSFPMAGRRGAFASAKRWLRWRLDLIGPKNALRSLADLAVAPFRNARQQGIGPCMVFGLTSRAALAPNASALASTPAADGKAMSKTHSVTEGLSNLDRFFGRHPQATCLAH